MKNFIRAVLTVVLLAGTFSVNADSTTVSAIGVKFDPMIVFIEPGDSVSFTGMAGHNVESIDELVPEGTPKFLSELGDDVTLQFDTVGIHVYKCTPHWGARMGGVVVVGQPENLPDIVDEYLAIIAEKRGNLLPAKGLMKKAGKAIEAKAL